MKTVSWYQNPLIAVGGIVSSLIFLVGLIFSLFWWGAKMQEMTIRMDKVEQAISLQVQYNVKVDVVYDLTVKK